MNSTRLQSFYLLIIGLLVFVSCTEPTSREVVDFNWDWKFQLGDDSLAYQIDYDDSQWRTLNLPHDWSIEGSFSEDHETRQAGGALPAGKGWYRKAFILHETDQDRRIYIDFGGVYRNSEVWINGEYLGKRPFGYNSFRYDLTSKLVFGDSANIMAVKVDNTPQPNSRWYTGSGIYRHVELVKTNQAHVAHWGTFITTPEVSKEKAIVALDVEIDNYMDTDQSISIKTTILDPFDQKVFIEEQPWTKIAKHQSFEINQPQLWSTDQPNLYQAITEVLVDGVSVDVYTTPFGIRFFHFDPLKGFFLNGEPLKIYGVNNHHDLGALGAAFNKRAAERQLQIMKSMGANGIRMAHNPPDEALLDLCDQMGFIVMDESFDEWSKAKAKRGYHLNWDDWHKRDLQDMVLRDRNHPSIFMWSIGNEIREQFDSTGITITRELASIVRDLDTTRLVTSALTENEPEKNFIAMSGALDMLGFNYKHEAYPDLPSRFPGQVFLASETNSAYATRGHYDMPSDSIQRWPTAHNVPIPNANEDYTVSSYDMIAAYWGSTHEETWKVVKRLDHMAGIYIWSGFDYLGEPTPYPYPARSSYFGVVDLAGFPKDSYYMYQCEWTKKPMLHVFPHWNWELGQEIDIWAYYNLADEVELFINEVSQGVKHKKGDDLHVQWSVKYEPGSYKVVARKAGDIVMEKEVVTASDASKIHLSVDRDTISGDGYDLSFVTVDILDENGFLAPNADNLVTFELSGPGKIVGTSNGYQASLEPFKTNYRKTWKGKCLVIVQSQREPGSVVLKATSEGLKSDNLNITIQ